MDSYLDKLPAFVDTIKSIKETIITNIVLIGQIPAPTFKEKRRTGVFMERLADFLVDECTTDGYRCQGNLGNKAAYFCGCTP
jgi:hypothetical protein